MKTPTVTNSKAPLCMPETMPKYDAAGTDPNRYANFSDKRDSLEDYVKEPENHTDINERMLDSNRGQS